MAEHESKQVFLCMKLINDLMFFLFFYNNQLTIKNNIQNIEGKLGNEEKPCF